MTTYTDFILYVTCDDDLGGGFYGAAYRVRKGDNHYLMNPLQLGMNPLANELDCTFTDATLDCSGVKQFSPWIPDLLPIVLDCRRNVELPRFRGQVSAWDFP